ncbi:hypothetical protein B5S33_g2827 [[Candida] boidinii]|nr:hypothetical protein B5S30_g3289 [[Candida] boidinii]OWB84185.1 hypothetical protein B5S33_g2827 [[Candida] boidinii]GMF50553.1 unnamed protein product [[Candida] boidinii]
MSELIPLATYNLAVEPYTMKASNADQPYTIRLTLAAIDPESVDEKKTPTTLRILKRKLQVDDFSDDEDLDLEDLEDSEDDEDSEDAEEGEAEEKKEEEEDEEEDAEEDEEDEDDEDLDEDEDDMEEHVICTLSPESQYQQSLDVTIMPEEEVVFIATGSYTIHLTGNYVTHPFDSDDEDEDDFEDDYDEDDYDLTPDEDEIIDGEDFDLDELEDVEDIEGKIEELVESDLEKKESKKSNNKRAIEEEETKKEEASPSKKSKKEKKEKTVQFKKELEQGPTPTKKEEPKPAKKEEKKKIPTKTLQGGVIVEDRTVGKGPVCKKGQKVGVRYVGKLKNGKVFDKNTSGKPFMFGLGKGEVIKGWDIGVAGMSVGGERRIVIPAPMAYGSQKLPGIPSNSELTFDVKLINIK